MKPSTPLDPELQEELGHHGPKWRDLAAGDINAHMDLAAIWTLRDWLERIEEGCGSADIA